MTRIFISYRREDSADICGRLYDRLKARFGHFNVFKDVDNIPPGVDFRTHMQSALQQSDVVVVVIGPQWLSGANSQGEPRLFAPEDFVRVEVEAALQLRKVIIPVLVNNATMPGAASLPSTISTLSFINASKLRPDPDFRHDCDSLMASIAVNKAANDLPMPRGMTGPTPQNLKALSAAYAAVTNKQIRPSFGKPMRVYFRGALLTLGALSFGVWVTALIIQYGAQQGHATTLTTYTLPAISIIIDVIGSLLAASIAIDVKRGTWVFWLLLLNILPVGVGPLVYGVYGPM